MGRHIRKILLWPTLACGFLGLFIFCGLFWYQQKQLPKPTTDWLLLHEGFQYRAWSIQSLKGNASMAMALKIDLKSQGIFVAHGPLHPRARETGKHFILTPADILIRRNNPLALVNATRYIINDWSDNLPGSAVSPLESVVISGNLTHQHPHSYLIWWTRSGDLHVETAKPPPEPLPPQAWMGVGVQGLQILQGIPQYQALDDLETSFPRTFIGVDPDADVLWLLAFESVTGLEMINEAHSLGIPFGGQLDSGDATNMILGKNVPGVKDYTGIRNLRPTAGYLAVILSEEAPGSTHQTSSTASTPDE